MKKLLILFYLLLNIGYGIDCSLRIRSLGTDFINLIPDYESDLFLDPNIYSRDNKLVGISYFPWEWEYNPLTLRLLTSRFGLMGKYWGDYYNISYSPDYGNRTRFFARDLWMWDARQLLPGFLSQVWNITNDLDFYKIEYSGCSNTRIKYLFGGPGATNIGRYFKSYNHALLGFYRDLYRGYAVDTDQLLIIITGKTGLSFRNTLAKNDFISAYIEIGGPTSIADIEALPFSPLLKMSGNDGLLNTYFCNALIATAAFGKGFPISEKGFIAVGFRDRFIRQRFAEYDTSFHLSAINNSTSIPIGLEYGIGQINFRLGTRLLYYIYYQSRYHEEVFDMNIYHTLSWSTSFGIGWRPQPKLNIDFYNRSDLLDVRYWGLYLKYEF